MTGPKTLHRRPNSARPQHATHHRSRGHRRCSAKPGPAAADVPAEPAPEAAAPGFAAAFCACSCCSVSPWIVAPVSGAVAAALVIGIGGMLGWPAVQPASPAAPQLNAAAIDDLTARIAGLKTPKPASPPTIQPPRTQLNPGKIAGRAARRSRATSRAQGEKLAAAAVNDVKAAPRAGAASRSSPVPDRPHRQDRRRDAARTAEIAQLGSRTPTPRRPMQSPPMM